MTSARILEPDSRVLLVKIGGIGDVVLASAALRALRARYPGACIDFLTSDRSGAELARSLLVFDTINELPAPFDRRRDTVVHPGCVSESGLQGMMRIRKMLRASRYDVIICMNHVLPELVPFLSGVIAASGAKCSVGLAPGFVDGIFDVPVPDPWFDRAHEAEIQNLLVESVGAPVTDLQPVIPVRPADVAEATRIVEGLFPRRGPAEPLFVLHPGSSRAHAERRWPAERFAATARALIQQFDGLVLLAGDHHEQALRSHIASGADCGDRVRFLDETPTMLLSAALISLGSLFIGNNSGLMHIAAGLDVPTIGIFGPTNSHVWRPYNPTRPHLAATVGPSGLYCAPCTFVAMDDEDRYGCGEFDCLRSIAPDTVVHRAGELLGLAVS
jgi:ADP-heptose:LPS heptosyltransferase